MKQLSNYPTALADLLASSWSHVQDHPPAHSDKTIIPPNPSKRHVTSPPSLAAVAHALQFDELEKAETLVRSRLAVAPNDVDAMHLLAVIAMRTGHVEPAERLLRSAISGRPDFILAHAELSSLLCH